MKKLNKRTSLLELSFFTVLASTLGTGGLKERVFSHLFWLEQLIRKAHLIQSGPSGTFVVKLEILILECKYD